MLSGGAFWSQSDYARFWRSGGGKEWQLARCGGGCWAGLRVDHLGLATLPSVLGGGWGTEGVMRLGRRANCAW